MVEIENVKLEISKEEDNLKGQAETLCSDGEVAHLNLDGATIWLVIYILQNFCNSLRRE